MLDIVHNALPTQLSVDEILAHPHFRAARNAMVREMLGLYENDVFLNRLLLEVGRNLVFVVIMCLDARYDESDRSTWPTLRAVTRAMAGFNLASPRRVADLVSRLIKTGYLEQVLAHRDRRVRLLRPTQKMIAQDQDWLVSHYAPLQVLFPKPGYARIMQRDPDFQRAQRLVSASFFPYAAQTMARHPSMMQFMVREGGIMIVIKLIELAGPDADTSRKIVYSDIGARFGVSRTQVRKLLQEAEKAGLVRLTQEGGRFVQLTPALIEAFDRFIADTMVGHDLMYKLALRGEAAANAMFESATQTPALAGAGCN
jgi:DNA-binding MarR family transcriptional regulator